MTNTRSSAITLREKRLDAGGKLSTWFPPGGLVELSAFGVSFEEIKVFNNTHTHTHTHTPLKYRHAQQDTLRIAFEGTERAQLGFLLFLNISIY